MATLPDLFDRAVFKKHRFRALKEAKPGADFLMKYAADDLAERLSLVTRSFEKSVDLGGHTGLVSRTLSVSGKVQKTLRGDLFFEDPNQPSPDFVFDDACVPLKPQSVDLIVSALTLQFVNDLPGSLVQIRQSLRPDGLFLATLLAAGTLGELRDSMTRAELELTGGAAARIAPFADTRDLGDLLQRAGYALPVTDLDTVTVRYDSMFALLGDLKAMGATSALSERSRKPLGRGVFARAAEIYASDHSDPDGRIRATFAFATLSGWAPHESQQKPLKPGSAKIRLSDALNSK